MPKAYDQFIEKSEIIPFDTEHRRKIKFNISRYDAQVQEGKKQYRILELAKRRAGYLKYRSFCELDKYLIDFELNMAARGGKVIWAKDAGEAIEEIIKILKKHDTRTIVKSRSMITEEIEFNEEMKKHKIEFVETDLGEFIVQLAGEKPYHITTPLMHKSKEDIAALFNEKYGTSENSTPKDVMAFVRKMLREKFIKAEVGVVGINFLVADTGAVCVTENEGNALMSVSFPKLTIAVGGIEKVIPSLEDLDLYWSLLSTFGTGQNITAYNTILTGPRQENETDGPDDMYVVLIDNGRTKLLEQEEQRRALSCIRCGACLNGCPVYKNMGGHAYGTTYSGPIGAVITPYMKGLDEYKHLSFASTLCGKCTEVCPVKIPLHELLLKNRNDAIKAGYSTTNWKFFMYGWKKIMLNRWMIDFFGAKTKNFAVKKAIKKLWGPRRELPEIKAKSFNQMWKESN